MSTNYSTDESSALFGKTRREVLALLFGRPDQAFYVREIINHLRVGQGSVQRELSRLAGASILDRTVRGNQVFYQANRSSPVFEELRSFMMKTTGAADIIRGALEPMMSMLKIAFIHGSIAAGKDTSSSDIDIVVIGNVSFKDVSAALTPVQGRLGREVNATVYSTSEFKRKVKSGHHFTSSVLGEPRIMVFGDEDDLKRMVE